LDIVGDTKVDLLLTLPRLAPEIDADDAGFDYSTMLKNQQ
jgi:hypothetical protein